MAKQSQCFSSFVTVERGFGKREHEQVLSLSHSKDVPVKTPVYTNFSIRSRVLALAESGTTVTIPALCT
ncbi:hypothetical protein HYDPIDRAFT_116322 [Hydnomerulius pinastri MD-312]|uniref:Uncharacterized protein n=1 Tax=Hydnomerulius pinastri MD-312 TaxID=994086 RepID=A0A0C9V637_9AGAM|nr:hypothetical protein HYDPIDRAFT_116322 [Hydnomerulius pinastri MD-312]